MIIKSVSRRNNTEQLIKYIFREQTFTPKSYQRMIDEIKAEHWANRTAYVAGIKLSKDNVRQLISESQDGKLLKEYRAFNGTIKEFVEQRLVGKISVIPKELLPLARTVRQYENVAAFTENLLYHGSDNNVAEFKTDKFKMLWTAPDPALAQAYISQKEVGISKEGTESKTADGTLYIISGKISLNLFDATQYPLDLNNPGKLERDFFKEKQTLGYDGIKVLDGVDTEQGKLPYFGVGVFAKALPKLNFIPIKANNVQVDKTKEFQHSPEFNAEKFYSKAIREPEPFIIRHNLRGESHKDFAKEFESNESNRIHTSSRQVAVHHTILSWADADAEKLTDNMLHDLANEYIRLRGENNIYLGNVHREKDHVHLHLMMSATRLDGISSRIPKDVFQEIKIKLQEYQKEKYPELISLPKHLQTNEKEVDKEAKNIKRHDERTRDKSVLVGLVETTYAKAKSVEEFLEEIRKQGHEPYYRNGQLQGIKFEGEQKFRFTNLGFSKEKIFELDAKKEKQEKELKELTELRTPKTRIQEIEQKDLMGRPIVIDDATKGMTEEEQRNYNQDILNQNRSFEQANGIQTDPGIPSLDQEAKPEIDPFVYENICDDCKREHDEPGYKSPQYYDSNGELDIGLYNEHMVSEYLYLQSLRGVLNVRYLTDEEPVPERNEDTKADSDEDKSNEKKDKVPDEKDQQQEIDRIRDLGKDDERSR